MRKGYLAIFLVLMMAIGVASSAQAYDNMAEPSAAVLVPLAVANTSAEAINGFLPGDDTAIALANLPNATAQVIDWTFFDDVTSAHLRDKKITVTPGEIYGMLWSIEKGLEFNGDVGYLVFAFPGLTSSSLTANAFFVDASLSFAAFIPTLQLVPGVDIFNETLCALDPTCSIPEIRDPGSRIWSSPRSAVNGIQFGDNIYPRYSNTTIPANDGSVLTSESLMFFWKPSLLTATDENVIQYNTITEEEVSCSIIIEDELEWLDPFIDVVGEDPFPEGAFLITGWPDDGGISWTFIFGFRGAAIVEAQTCLTPHWSPLLMIQ
jgi:hypothetical protein